MAGLRGYPQPGYKPAARDFQQSPPPVPKNGTPPAQGGTADQNLDRQILNEILDGTSYSKREKLLLEAILDAGQEAVEAVADNTVAKRVPGKLVPVVNAFLLGYTATNIAIDAYEWWVSTQANPNNTSVAYGGYVAHQTAYEFAPFSPGANPTKSAFGWSPDTIGTMPATYGGGTYPSEVYWYWWPSVPSPSYFTGTLLGDTAPFGENLDPVSQTLGLQVTPPKPRIPFKLIPYVNPDPTPAPAPKTQPSGWFITNGPTPPDTTGYRDTPGREKKKQLTGAGAAAMRVAKALINAATESCDAIEAIWDAIPEKTRVNLGYQRTITKYKRVGVSDVQRIPVAAPGPKGASFSKNFGFNPLYEPEKPITKKPPLAKDALGNKIVESTRLSRISCTGRAKAFATNPRLLDEVDWTKAINNLILNQIEDAVFGFAGSKANDAFVNTPGYNRPVGLGTGSVF